jgi:phosphoribosylformylglycinamidine (FGAM) synthase PurS component
VVSRDVQPTGRNGLHRLTITTHDTDPRAAAIAAAARQLGIADLDDVTVSDIVFVHGELDDGGRTLLTAVLVDPLLQHGTWDDPDHTPPTQSVDGATTGSAAVEIVLHAGVTDSGATAVEHAADTLGLRGLQVATGRRVSFGGALDPATIDEVVTKIVANPVIEHWASPTVTPQFDFGSAPPTVDTVADDEALAAINAERSLSLDPTEELRRSAPSTTTRA